MNEGRRYAAERTREVLAARWADPAWREYMTAMCRGPKTWKPKPCGNCGAEFQPTGGRAMYCPPCRELVVVVRVATASGKRSTYRPAKRARAYEAVKANPEALERHRQASRESAARARAERREG